MLIVLRPVFEEVREGRILYKIKHLQSQIVGFFFCASLGPGFARKWMFLTEKLNWKYSSPQQEHHLLLNLMRGYFTNSLCK